MQLKNMRVHKEEHDSRLFVHNVAGKFFKHSVKDLFKNEKENFRFLEKIHALYPYDFLFTTASEENCYSLLPFGATNTISGAGSAVFATAFIRRLYAPEEKFRITKWAREVADKGYRSWHFTGEKYKSETFTSVTVKSSEVAERFGIPELNGCSKEELESKLGKIEGIGVSYFLIDNVISELTGVAPVLETRIRNVDELIRKVAIGIPVIIRLENTVYHNDPGMVGGHYVVLIGMTNGQFVVADSSIGILLKPIQDVLRAATVGRCAVWNCVYVPKIL